jgi:hypothetical protein
MPTRQIFNATTQQVEEAELSVDQNNEIVATFADGNFVKFPAGMTAEEFEKQIALVQAHNEGQEIVTPEMEAAKEAERAASLALINGNTMPEGDKTNAPRNSKRSSNS